MNVLISCGCTTSCIGSCSCYKKGLVCTQLDADVQDTAMGLQSSSYAAFKLTPLLSCSMYNPVSTEHSIIIYCDTHLWLSFFIFIPVRVRVPVATIQLHLSWRWWFLILFGVISDVTFNKVVSYNMYDDVDDSYNLWHHQMFIEMY